MPGRIHPKFIHDYITVTDIPNMNAGVITGYNYLPADSRAVKIYQNAGAGMTNADTHLQFWKNLGHAVDLNKVARCHGCAAYAARVLHGSNFHVQNGLSIWICGRGDHYFVILSPAGGLAPGMSNLTTAAFNATDIVVDLWFYNVTRQTAGRLDVNTMAMTLPNFAFIAGANDIRVFAQYV